MYANIYRLLLAMFALLLLSCTTACFTSSPYVPLTMDAIHHFYDMKETGKLPGISKDMHGNLQTGAIPQSGPVVYPVCVTIHVTKASDDVVYWYLFTKETKL